MLSRSLRKHYPRGQEKVRMEVDTLCLEYVNGQSTSEPPKLLAKGIESGQTDLVRVVEALGLYLTSTNVDNRNQGTRLLSEVLTVVRPNALQADEVHYLAVFYCDRLKDRAVILPNVLSGVHSLVTRFKLSDEDVVLLCRAIFKEVHNQSLQYTERRLVYFILDHFLNHYLQAVQLIGSDFVLGFIQTIDEERDPRNLLVIFNSVPLVIQHLPFDTLTEDLFEVTSCYFPIDFNPPPNDPQAVSREALIQSLRRCLTATPRFAEFCFPLLLEKLSSDIQSAKLDSLLTLATGAAVYGLAGLKPFQQEIWSSIKREVYQTSSRDVQSACVSALEAVARCLSTPLQRSGDSGGLTDFIDMALKDCQRHIREPELRLIQPTVVLLCGIAKASDPACTHVVSHVLPTLIQQYLQVKQSSHRVTLLEAICAFVATVRHTVVQDEVSPPLLEHKTALLDILLAAFTDVESNVRNIAVMTTSEMIQVKGILDHSELLKCCQLLKSTALADNNNVVRESGRLSLSHVAALHPSFTREHLLEPLISQITGPTTANCSSLTCEIGLVSCLASANASLLTPSLPSLVTRLDQLVVDGAIDSLATSISGALVNIVKESIHHDSCRALLRGGSEKGEGLMERLVAVCVRCCGDMGSTVVRHVAQLLSCYVQHADDNDVKSLLELIVSVAMDGDVGLSEAQPPSTLSRPVKNPQLVQLMTAVVGAAKPQVVLCYSEQLLPTLFQLACNCSFTPVSEHAAKAYASIVNKLPNDDSLSALLERDMELLWKQLADSATCETNAVSNLQVLTVWIWLSKALVMRGHKMGVPAVIKLLELCCMCTSISKEAGAGFQLLMTDTTDILNRDYHANVRLFYKQQLFTKVLPELIRQFKSSEHGKRQHILRALSHLMRGVPKQVLLSELPSVLPLLLDGLSSDEGGLKLSTLEGLLSLINDTPDSVVEHVPTLIPRLLQLARDKSSMKVRMAALKCIGASTRLPTHVVYPYQGSVIKELAHCLDDHKRLVRKDAVDARSRWYSLGTV